MDALLLLRNGSRQAGRERFCAGGRLFYRTSGFSWYNDFMDDHCSCFILRSVLFGSAAWPGENHKSYDDVSSGTDRSACGSFSYA